MKFLQYVSDDDDDDSDDILPGCCHDGETGRLGKGGSTVRKQEEKEGGAATRVAVASPDDGDSIFVDYNGHDNDHGDEDKDEDEKKELRSIPTGRKRIITLLLLLL